MRVAENSPQFSFVLVKGMKLSKITKSRTRLLFDDSHRASDHIHELTSFLPIIFIDFRMSSSESSSGSGSAGRAEDEKDPEETKIAKKEEKEIDSVTDFHVEKESEKLSNALLSFTDSSQTEAGK